MAGLQKSATRGAVVPVAIPQKAIPEFGLDPNAIRVITIPLDTALKDHEVDVTGTVLWAVNASSLSAAMDVKLQTQRNDKIPVSKGFFLRGARFSHLYITAAAQAGESITLLLAKETGDKLEIINPSSDFTSVSTSKSANLGSVADVTVAHGAAAAVCLAADATRREALIYNSGTVDVRIGDSNIGAARGTWLPAGQEITLATTDDIYAYNPSGATDTTLAITTVLD